LALAWAATTVESVAPATAATASAVAAITRLLREGLLVTVYAPPLFTLLPIENAPL
jgi:hypothetical protein